MSLRRRGTMAKTQSRSPRRTGPEYYQNTTHPKIAVTANRPKALEDRITELEQVECTCESYGYCWSCADIARLRARLSEVA